MNCRNDFPTQLSGNDRKVLLCQFLPHIHYIHCRQDGVARPERKLQMSNASGNCPVICLKRRRSTSQQQYCAVIITTAAGNFPGMIRGPFFLFVTILLFLVNDYQAQVFKRCKDSAAHTNQNVGLTGPHLIPHVAPFIL